VRRAEDDRAADLRDRWLDGGGARLDVESGQGIGVQVRETSCTGTSVECTWQANGSYSKTLPLPAGTWFFVVERSPEGDFSFEIEEQ
jgi:hypothetical protein